VKLPRSIVFLIVGVLIGVLLSGIFLLIFGMISINTLPPLDNSAISVDSEQIIPTKDSSEAVNNTGKININSADISTLNGLPGIGEEKARAIISFREKYGNFQELEELLYVPGIGENLFNAILPRITLEVGN
jgi:competence ComEA-like helix-hairpin-helix protein